MRRPLLVLALLLSAAPVAAQEQASTPPQARTVLAGRARDGVVGWADAARLAPLYVGGAYRAIDGVARDVTVDGLYADGLVRGGVRLRKGSRNVTLRRFRLVHGAAPNAAPHLPEGIDIQGCTGCTIEDGYLSGYRSTGMAYPNGDGLNVEHGVSDLVLRRITSEGQSDSAFDLLKGGRIRGYDLVGRDSTRCVKTGALDVVVTTVTCVGVRTAIELHGGSITIGTLVYGPGGRTTRSWLFTTEAGAHGPTLLKVERCVAPDGGPVRLPSADSVWLVQGRGVTVDLGPSCRDPGR